MLELWIDQISESKLPGEWNTLRKSKMRAAMEVVLESEVENTEPDLERKRPTLLVFFCKGIYIRKSFGCQ
jgi:hypothetical protein